MSSFAFKQFTVANGECAMRVGTDGTLLGAWAEGGRTILDIGTGTGLIALMMAQRFAMSEVKAIDIIDECCRQATMNVEDSPFHGRISVEQADIKDYATGQEHYFDAIVSNPPYFVDALPSQTASRNVARHVGSMPYDSLFKSVVRLLRHSGTFSAIIPTVSLPKFTAEAALCGLCLSRRVDISTVESKPVSRHLLEFRHDAVAVATEKHFLQNADGTRSEWYSRLTADFYKW